MEMASMPPWTTPWEFERYLPTPPILTSQAHAWEHLVVRAYHEPADLEETPFPATTAIGLIVVTSGTVLVEERKPNGPWRAYLLNAGDWFVSPAYGEPYALRWRSLTAVALKTLHLHLSVAAMQQYIETALERDATRFALTERTGVHDPLLLQLALGVQQELLTPQPAAMSQLYAASTAQMIAAHLVRTYGAPHQARPVLHGTLTPRQVRQIQAFIRAHLLEPLTLAAIAADVGMSAYHLARLYRQTTGRTLHQAVVQERLDAAQRLLRETRLPIAQIARSVGFLTGSHFAQVFHRTLGVSPQRYRHEWS